MKVVELGLDEWHGLADSWDALAGSSPFLTHGWLRAWWAVYGRGAPLVLALRDESRLRAAAILRRSRAGAVDGPANAHTGDWDVVAADDASRAALWAAIADRRAPYVRLPAMRADTPELVAAKRALAARDYRFAVTPGAQSPYLALPPSADALMAGVSRNLRSQVGRRRRALARQGRLEFRVSRGASRLDEDFEAFVGIEGSGWKARAGTSLATDARARALYAAFARSAAARDELRLYLLELDGRVIAGDLGFVKDGVGSLIKTGYRPELAEWSPGLVLRADVLRACIDESLTGYDFLGGADDYKLRWASGVRPRVTLHAFRGPAALAGGAWYGRARPAMVRARDAYRRSCGEGSAGSPA